MESIDAKTFQEDIKEIKKSFGFTVAGSVLTSAGLNQILEHYSRNPRLALAMGMAAAPAIVETIAGPLNDMYTRMKRHNLQADSPISHLYEKLKDIIKEWKNYRPEPKDYDGL